MSDVHTKEQRTYNMSKIKAKNTKPELTVRKFCHTIGLRFRLHVKDMPGKPDLYFPKYKLVIFVNGCFWHRHSCSNGKVFPKTNAIFWKNKFCNTVNRDKANILALHSLGIMVYNLWECEIKKEDIFKYKIRQLFSKRKNL